jgi:Flp pilus assembly protein TadG
MTSRQRAQIVPLFALGLLAFLALVGLVIDGGTLYLQRRTAQNAADAAALAGARALQQSSTQNTGTIADAICTYLGSNAFGTVPTATAYFVATNGTTNLGPITFNPGCTASPSSFIPNGASGVHVDVTVGPYNTFLVGIIGIRQMTATASATAQVGVLSIPGPLLTPLAGCGQDMLRDPQNPNPHDNILNADGSLNLTTYQGRDYILEGSQTAQDSNSSCPAWNGGSSAWKGRVDVSGLTDPGSFLVPGTTPVPVEVPVDTGNANIDPGIVATCMSLYNSDPTGTSAGSPSGCYLLIPIAAPPNPANYANIVTIACFQVYDGGGLQKWRGFLQPINPTTCNYGVYQRTWTWGNTFSETQVMLTS